ncbi:MAG: excinuclease ABC subunit C [Candidatus Altiarchaeales archaeon ex4484_2]|nr:MAG: excinuclease ABC subunit C [Candidatus Altiarchaeales archaeon ex4484_2]
MMIEQLIGDINAAPRKAGVYLFKDAADRILYIGKADNLADRLKSYLSPADAKTSRLVKAASSVETILTANAHEALILEDALVKQNQPRYNVRLRDDKNYPYIKVAVGERYPYLEVVRRITLDGSRYFGPYTDVRHVRKTMNLVSELFGIRQCKYMLSEMERPCLKYDVGRCCAPHLITSEAEYRKRVEQAVSFLSGDYKRLSRKLMGEIKNKSKILDFEEAARLKKTVDVLDSLSVRQNIDSAKLVDMDVLGYATVDGRANICQLKIRKHRVVAVLQHPLTGVYADSEAQAVKAFIKQHYVTEDITPKLIVSSVVPGDRSLLQENLSKLKKVKVLIVKSMRGSKRRLTELALENSIHHLKQEKLRGERVNGVDALRKALKLDGIPERIEGYDISNLGDKFVVGSMVVFTDGAADKKEYRRFRIRSGVQDDPANLAEMLSRRFGHVEWGFPDLVLLDGGRAQLNAGRKEVPEDIPVISLAKRLEEIYLVGVDNPLSLPADHPGRLLLAEVRDEAHRFAKKYHTLKRKKEFIEDNIER